MPKGDPEGDAHHHDHGGGEGEERSPKGQGTVGVATAADGGIHAEDEQEGDGEGELGGVFLTVDGRTDGGEEGGEEEVAADEVEDEENEDFEEGEIECCGEGLGDVLGQGGRRALELCAGRGGMGGRGSSVGGETENDAAHREQQGDERAPNGELGDADEGDTDDFAHHELEGADARHHDFHDAVGFLFEHALEHHHAVGHDEDVDEHGGEETDGASEGGRRSGVASVGIPLVGAGFHIALHVGDDDIELRNVVVSEFLLAHGFVEVVFHIVDEVGLHFLGTGDAQCIGVPGEVAADFDHGFVGAVGGFVVGAQHAVDGEREACIGLEGRGIAAGGIDERDLACRLVIAYATQQNGRRDDAHEEEGHEEGEYDEGSFAHAGEKLAADDEEYLIHGRGLRGWRGRRRRCARRCRAWWAGVRRRRWVRLGRRGGGGVRRW